MEATVCAQLVNKFRTISRNNNKAHVQIVIILKAKQSLTAEVEQSEGRSDLRSSNLNAVYGIQQSNEASEASEARSL
jgi:hypothetical protein